jgi:hypothetical protein
VSGGADPRGSMHEQAGVLGRLAGVDPDADPNPLRQRPLGIGKRPLDGYCRADAVTGAVGHGEERISVCPELATPVQRERMTHRVPLLLEQSGVLDTGLAQKTPRSLDVGEQKGDRPSSACGGQRVSRASLGHRQHVTKSRGPTPPRQLSAAADERRFGWPHLPDGHDEPRRFALPHFPRFPQWWPDCGNIPSAHDRKAVL